MKNELLFCTALLCLGQATPAWAQPKPETATAPTVCTYVHPWQGKRVAFFGDSITDPRLKGDKIKKYWDFLKDWLGITPYVYGISGRQWNDIPNQTERLAAEHGDEVDAIIILMGTNDYNNGVPIGEWFSEQVEEVEYTNDGKPKRMAKRLRRTPIFTNSTYRGRINIALSQLKQKYPTRSIVLLTPLHRGSAYFNDNNVQPDESYQNSCGEYLDAYVTSVKEAGSIWALPVIDLQAISGLQPMVKEQLLYFWDAATDQLHPSTLGQERMARTVMQQLLLIPAE